MLANDVFDFTLVPLGNIVMATATTLAGFIGSFLLLIFGGIQLTNTRLFKRVALIGVQDRAEGYTAIFRDNSLMGLKGIAQTVLRPSGRVIIESEVYDAYTRGEFILEDEEIEVISEEGTTLLVKKVSEKS